jgi:energy-coupling factor transporter ATP-binding protein EcfA2
VSLKSFKGFRDFRIPLEAFTNIVGLNSRGKTSILQAVRFAFELMRHAFNGSRRGADFGNVQWSFGPSDVLNRYSLSDPAAIWFGRNTTSPCQVTLRFSGDIEVEAKVTGPSRCELDVRFSGKSSKHQPLTEEQRIQIHELLALNVVFVPPLGATSSVEHWLNKVNFDQEAQRGRYAETWRNSLFWLYNDGDKDSYKRVVELVLRYIPDAAILPPRLSGDHSPNVIIEFKEHGQKYDIGLSGAGMRSLLNLAAVLLLSESRVILLDEPDAHLHGTLQRSIARMLADFSAEHGVQIITATHAPEFLSETPIESVRWVDRGEREARPANSLARVLVDLGSISSTEAANVGAAAAVLFVEGLTDKRVLASAFVRCGLKDPTTDSTVAVAKLPDGKSSADGVRMLPTLMKSISHRDIRVACLVDNDWELTGETSAPSDDGIVSLPRKEIENHLIEPSVFAVAAKRAAEKRGGARYPEESAVRVQLDAIIEPLKETVRCQLAWRYRESLSNGLDHTTREQRAGQWFAEKWKDPEWRIRAVPGKIVLASLRRWCQSTYQLTVSDRLLADSMVPDPALVKALGRISTRLGLDDHAATGGRSEVLS